MEQTTNSHQNNPRFKSLLEKVQLLKGGKISRVIIPADTPSKTIQTLHKIGLVTVFDFNKIQ